MEKVCAICGKIATKVDFNGEKFCNLHINSSAKNEKKTKRVYLDESDYWAIAVEAAKKNIDIKTHLSHLIWSSINNKLQSTHSK